MAETPLQAFLSDYKMIIIDIGRSLALACARHYSLFVMFFLVTFFCSFRFDLVNQFFVFSLILMLTFFRNRWWFFFFFPLISFLFNEYWNYVMPMHTHYEHSSFTLLSIKQQQKIIGKLKINIDFDNNLSGITFTQSIKKKSFEMNEIASITA